MRFHRFGDNHMAKLHFSAASATLLAALILCSPAAAANITIDRDNINVSGLNNVINHGIMIDDEAVNVRIINHNGESTLEGSGSVTEQKRPIKTFDRLVLESIVDVKVKRSKTEKFSIIADDNLIDNVESSIQNGTLVIGTGGSFITSNAIDVVLEVPVLRHVNVKSTGTVTLEDVSDDNLELVISGTGSIHASGHVNQLTVSVEGTGDIDAFDLKADDVTVIVDGSGDAKVTAIQSLHATITGMGDLTYRGNPRSVQTDISGMGDVIKQ